MLGAVRPSVTTERQRGLRQRATEKGLTVYGGALTGAGPGRGRAGTPARGRATSQPPSRTSHPAGPGKFSLLAYWVTSDDSIMTFDNLIEADFISQSVYSYTCARPNTLPSSHMEMLNMLP